jgi:glycosyltransferase involved in cell wall biosynthesis
MKVTAVVITKDRPAQLRRLIDSVLDSKIPSLSLVLIDDSTRENFERTKNFLLTYSDICKHRSSLQVRRAIESVLKKARLPTTKKSLIETCVGSKSPFLDFAKSLSKVFLFRNKFSALLLRSFNPYSTARNLGIYHAYRVFNPEKIVFLDDDCYIERPERLRTALQLIGKKVDGKDIVAVSGLYEDLALSRRKGRHPYEKLTATSILTGMNSFLKRSFLTDQEQRLTVMPYHVLGGALILSKKVFLSLPFDPFIPRGEDHAFCLDFKARYSKDLAIVRDNLFIVQHNSNAVGSRNLEEINALRDIYRFVYLRFKVGQSFIPFFTIRRALNALIHMSLEPSKGMQRLFELWTLFLLARIYAKRKANSYYEIAKTWEFFLKRVIHRH